MATRQRDVTRKRDLTRGRPLRSRIDLEAVQCVDLGHHWEQTFLGRAETGQLRGLPLRVCVCATCHTRREDHLTWSGTVTSRVYDHDDAYIENSRKLDDNHHERRRRYREEMVKSIRDQKIDAIDAKAAS